MLKNVAALLFVLSCSFCYAQSKTDVLVIGGTPSGVAAAIQCARSKVKTIIIESGAQLCPHMKDEYKMPVDIGKNLPSGIWGEFRKRIREYEKAAPGQDTAFNAALQFEPSVGAIILAGIADTVKKLTIKLNTQFIAIKKDDDEWQVTYKQGGKTETIKARVVIDGTVKGDVAGFLKAGITVLDENVNRAGLQSYRTSVACGDGLELFKDLIRGEFYPGFPNYCVPIKTFMASGVDNLLITQRLMPAGPSMQFLPEELAIGQGAGVIAAYCAFFKTTTKNLNVRMIQGELLDFKGYLLPLADVSTDPYNRAIQQVCASGLLKGETKDLKFLFMPDSLVTTAEVKPALLEIYTRAFLWFNKEKTGEKFTVGNLVSFISELTLTDRDNMRKTISAAWKTKYKFTTAFDMNKPLTRREFAILANKYLDPFARTVDLNGRIVN